MKVDLKNLLEEKLEPRELRLVAKSYDVVGDIAVIKLPKSLRQQGKTIAEAIMQTHKRVKTVLRQVGSVSGDFRLRELKWVAGERKTETTYREYGVTSKVDLKTCYFSPRLSHERMRIAQEVQPEEVIINMFAGIGCFSTLIARHSAANKIYSIDVNPAAIQYMRENTRLNRVEECVIPIQGDAKRVVEEKLQNIADRVLMPLPEKAYEYLDYALLALKPSGGWMHYYDFEHARKGEDPVEEIKMKVSEKLEILGVSFVMPFGRIVRTTGPNWYQVVLDVWVQKS